MSSVMNCLFAWRKNEEYTKIDYDYTLLPSSEIDGEIHDASSRLTPDPLSRPAVEFQELPVHHNFFSYKKLAPKIVKAVVLSGLTGILFTALNLPAWLITVSAVSAFIIGFCFPQCHCITTCYKKIYGPDMRDQSDDGLSDIGVADELSDIDDKKSLSNGEEDAAEGIFPSKTSASIDDSAVTSLKEIAEKIAGEIETSAISFTEDPGTDVPMLRAHEQFTGYGVRKLAAYFMKFHNFTIDEITQADKQFILSAEDIEILQKFEKSLYF